MKMFKGVCYLFIRRVIRGTFTTIRYFTSRYDNLTHHQLAPCLYKWNSDFPGSTRDQDMLPLRVCAWLLS